MIAFAYGYACDVFDCNYGGIGIIRLNSKLGSLLNIFVRPLTTDNYFIDMSGDKFKRVGRFKGDEHLLNVPPPPTYNFFICREGNIFECGDAFKYHGNENIIFKFCGVYYDTCTTK